MVFTHVPSYIVLCRSTAKSGAAKIKKVEIVTLNVQVREVNVAVNSDSAVYKSL